MAMGVVGRDSSGEPGAIGGAVASQNDASKATGHVVGECGAVQPDLLWCAETGGGGGGAAILNDEQSPNEGCSWMKRALLEVKAEMAGEKMATQFQQDRMSRVHRESAVIDPACAEELRAEKSAADLAELARRAYDDAVEENSNTVMPSNIDALMKLRVNQNGENMHGRSQSNFISKGEEAGHHILQLLRPDTSLGSFQLLIQSKYFTTITAFLILSNALFIGFETDLNTGGHASAWWIVEVTFSALFSIELIVRFLAGRRTLLCKDFISDYWNLFDFLLVGASILGNVVDGVIINSPTSDGSAGGGAAQQLVILRVFRTLRLARVVRILRISAELQLIIAGLYSSLRVLIWVWVLLFLVIFIFAVFTTRLVGHAHEDDPVIYEHVGTIPKSMFTFTAIMTTEGWATVARDLAAAEWWTIAVILIYLTVTTFAMVNVVIAVIVNATMEKAAELGEEKQKKRDKDIQEAGWRIALIFETADIDGDGSLTPQEFNEALELQEVKDLLLHCSITNRDANEIFRLLDTDESGTLTCDEFVDGVQRMRGNARAKDLFEIHCSVAKIFRSVGKTHRLYGKAFEMSGRERITNTDALCARTDALRDAVEAVTSRAVATLSRLSPPSEPKAAPSVREDLQGDFLYR